MLFLILFQIGKRFVFQGLLRSPTAQQKAEQTGKAGGQRGKQMHAPADGIRAAQGHAVSGAEKLLKDNGRTVGQEFHGKQQHTGQKADQQPYIPGPGRDEGKDQQQYAGQRMRQNQGNGLHAEHIGTIEQAGEKGDLQRARQAGQRADQRGHASSPGQQKKRSREADVGQYTGSIPQGV